MVFAVVEVLKDNILKRKATLSVPIVLFHGMDDLFDGIGLLNGHQFESFVVEGAVHTDGKIAFRLFEETFKVGNEAARRHRDARRAPTQGPFLSEDVEAAHQVVLVRQRLAHTHEYDVGQLVELGQAENLVHDFGH